VRGATPNAGSVAPSRLVGALNTLGAAIITSLVTVIMSVSLAVLVFSGPMSPYVDTGITMFLATAVLGIAVMGLMSTVPQAVAMADDDTTPLLALMVATVGAGVAGSDPEAMFVTVIISIVITTLATGIFLLILGNTRWGRFIEHLPYSVIGGYFAAAGWLLVAGGFLFATGEGMDGLLEVGDMSATRGSKWLLTLLVGVLVFFLAERYSKAVVVPSVVLGGAVVFHALAAWRGLSTDALFASGHLLGQFAGIGQLLPQTFVGHDFGKVEWLALLSAIPSIGSILLLSALSILLSISGLGLLVQRDLPVDRELRVAGVANLVSGIGGGLICLHSLSLSALAVAVGGRERKLTAWLVAGFCAVVLALGLPLIGYFPRSVLGGLLVYLGFSFLKEWLIDGYARLPFYEYAVIPLILVVVVTVGFLEGVLIGLLASTVLFVVNYGRVRVIRYRLTGAEQKSNVERPAAEERLLRESGARLLIIGLQGYMFFGTARDLYDSIAQRVDATDQPKLDYVVLDCAKINGLDSTTAFSFLKLTQLADRRDFTIVFAGLNPDIVMRLERSGFDVQGMPRVQAFPEADQAIEWCENRTLAEHAGELTMLSRGIMEQVTALFDHPEDAHVLMGYLDEQDVPAGEVLCVQDSLSDELYFIEEGTVSVYLITNGTERHRIRRTGAGTVFGEMGFYLGVPRTASVETDTVCKVFTLTRAALDRMEVEHPEAASVLHRFMVRMMAERLANTTRTLQAVFN